VEVSKSQSIAGQLVQVWRPDLAAETGQITEAQIICYDDEEVGPLGLVGRLHVAVKPAVPCSLLQLQTSSVGQHSWCKMEVKMLQL
jgi:hypothetical protein